MIHRRSFFIIRSLSELIIRPLAVRLFTICSRSRSLKHVPQRADETCRACAVVNSPPLARRYRREHPPLMAGMRHICMPRSGESAPAIPGQAQRPRLVRGGTLAGGWCLKDIRFPKHSPIQRVKQPLDGLPQSLPRCCYAVCYVAGAQC